MANIFETLDKIERFITAAEAGASTALADGAAALRKVADWADALSKNLMESVPPGPAPDKWNQEKAAALLHRCQRLCPPGVCATTEGPMSPPRVGAGHPVLTLLVQILAQFLAGLVKGTTP